MKFTLNALNDWIDLAKIPPGGDLGQTIATALTRRGLEVESFRRLDQGFEKVIAAEILEKKKHPEADRLSLCKMSIGEGMPTLDIVCGAQNMKTGDIVPLAQVGALLPNGLKIEKSTIRGQVSYGMLCSEEELKLKETSDGLLILPPGTQVGTPVSRVLGLDDTVFELSLTPNRGDCLSVRGIAREIAAEFGLSLNQVATHDSWKKTASSKAIRTQCLAGNHASRFLACRMDGVRVGLSPDWLIKRLESMGSRSINTVVDATNLVMLELGHPIHAYDAAHIQGDTLMVRFANSGESIELLDGKTVACKGEELVIADAKQALGLAGVMGGASSQVTEATTQIVLECALFSPTKIRQSAKIHAIHSEASTRFEKGVDLLALETVMGRLVYWVQELCGGKVVGAHDGLCPESIPFESRRVAWNSDSVSELLGLTVPKNQSELILRGLGFEFKGSDVIVPSYRNDVSIVEDLIEEVARSIGYDAIPTTLPASAENALVESPGRFEKIEQSRDIIAAHGFLESVHFAFAGTDVLKRYGYQGSVRVQNPLSEVGEWLVPSLLPHMLEAAQYNGRHRFGSEPLPIRLFQIRPTFATKGEVKAMDTHQTGVTETWRVGLVMAGASVDSPYLAEHRAIDFFDLKGMVQSLSEKHGVRGLRIKLPEFGGPIPSLFHPMQSAEIWVGKQRAGFFGSIHPKVALDLKMRERFWLAEWDWDIWTGTATYGENRNFKMWKDQPKMERDFSLEVPLERIHSEQLIQVAMKAAHPVVESARIFDLYPSKSQGQSQSRGMTSVAVRVIFSVEGRSIVEQDAETASQKIVEAWKRELGVALKGG